MPNRVTKAAGKEGTSTCSENRQRVPILQKSSLATVRPKLRVEHIPKPKKGAEVMKGFPTEKVTVTGALLGPRDGDPQRADRGGWGGGGWHTALVLGSVGGRGGGSWRPRTRRALPPPRAPTLPLSPSITMWSLCRTGPQRHPTKPTGMAQRRSGPSRTKHRTRQEAITLRPPRCRHAGAPKQRGFVTRGA